MSFIKNFNQLKFIFTLIFTLFLFVGCTNTTQDRITELHEQLKLVDNKESEKKVLTEIWSIAYHSSGEVRIDVTVIDANEIMVSNDISKGALPVMVTIELSESNWSKKIEFTPIDIENVYLLFGE